MTLLAMAAGSPPTATAAAPRHHAVSGYALPGDSFYPEGVARDPHRRVAYVAGVTDGTIVRIALRTGKTTTFSTGGADGRTTAAGLKVDNAGRLYVAAGGLGTVFVYDTRTGRLLGRFSNHLSDTFLNDLAIAPNGDVFVTDSTAPILWRLPVSKLGGSVGPVQAALEPFADLNGVVDYDKSRATQPSLAGFNSNGIVVSADGRTVLFADMDSSALYRVDVASRRVEPVTVHGGPVTADGLLLAGGYLYAVDAVDHPGNAIVKIKMDQTWHTARVLSRTTRSDLRFPATIALDRGDLLVTNIQFDRLSAGQPPVLPFTVSRLPRP